MRKGSRLLGGWAMAGCLWAGSAGATDAVVTTCNESGLVTALSTVDGSGGGTITFNCGTATITFTSYKQISNAVTIDGGGKITFDGNNSSAFFQIFFSANVTLRNLTLKRGAYTGGVHVVENFGTLTLDRVTMSSNTAAGATDGGAIAHTGTFLKVTASTFNGNSAGRYGAAIFATGPFAVVNSTFTANSAASGGGAIYDTSGSASTISYATIVSNSAPFGAGLYSVGDGGGHATLTIGKSIVSANSTGNCDGVLASSGYNLSNDSGCGSVFTQAGDLLNQTLNMGALANNGGPTATMLPQAGNPAINHVPLAQCAPNVDQRGGGRPSGAGCDSGAVEAGAVLDVIFFDGFD